MQQVSPILLHPPSPVHTTCDFHLHQTVAHTVLHLHDTISKHTLGIGSSVIRTEASWFSSNFHPVFSSLGNTSLAPDARPLPGNQISSHVVWMRCLLQVAFLGYGFYQGAQCNEAASSESSNVLNILQTWNRTLAFKYWTIFSFTWWP